MAIPVFTTFSSGATNGPGAGVARRFWRRNFGVDLPNSQAWGLLCVGATGMGQLQEVARQTKQNDTKRIDVKN